MTDITYCPRCHAHEQVIDSRPCMEFIRRNRRCPECKNSWRSVEVPASYLAAFEATMEHVQKIETYIDEMEKKLSDFRAVLTKIRDEGLTNEMDGSGDMRAS